MGYILMKKLNANGLKVLKIVHLFFVAIWVGGNISAVLLSFMPLIAQDNTLLGIYLAMEFIDYFVMLHLQLANKLQFEFRSSGKSEPSTQLNAVVVLIILKLV